MRSASPWSRLRDLLGDGREGVRPDLQLALLRLDDEARKRLRQRCGGNWNRVSVGEDGTFTVRVTRQSHTHPDGPSGHERKRPGRDPGKRWRG